MEMFPLQNGPVCPVYKYFICFSGVRDIQTLCSFSVDASRVTCVHAALNIQSFSALHLEMYYSVMKEDLNSYLAPCREDNCKQLRWHTFTAFLYVLIALHLLCYCTYQWTYELYGAYLGQCFSFF